MTRRASTLVEMLVLVSILSVLASLLLPALAGAKAQSQTLRCKNNLAQIGKALAMYTGDYHKYLGSYNAPFPVHTGPYSITWTKWDLVWDRRLLA
jgi:type II secretory pathway pseudopilin PulG